MRVSKLKSELNVKAVTKLTGLNEHTLRAWERRYKAVNPKRGGNGRRVYSTDDVERLRLLVQLQDSGHGIGHIASLENAELKYLLTQSAGISGATTPEHEGLAPTLQAIEHALRTYDLHRIHLELNRARHRFGARMFALQIVAPIMGIIGRLVFSEEMSIAQEHALSAIVKCHLSALLYNIHHETKLDPGAPSFAISTMEGDIHDIGIMVSSVICASHGIPCHYLGPNMPPQPLAEACAALHVSHVLIGKAQLPPGYLAITEDLYVNTLLQRLPKKVELWLGGAFQLDLNKVSDPARIKFVQSLTMFDQWIDGMALV